MRHWLAVAALGAALLMLPGSVWAQRGGGGHAGGFGGGGHASFASHGGFASRGSMPMTRSSGPIITNGWHGNGYGPHRPYNGYWHGYPYSPYYPYYPYAGYYGWGYSAAWDPWWGWGSGWSDDSYPAQTTNYYQYPQYAPTDEYADSQSQSSYSAGYQSGQQQAEIDRLSDEVTRLREAQSVPKPPAKVGEPTELVFRDKHTEQIENYAIVGQTLWILNEQRSRKIPLSDLDLGATQQANEARGVDFEVPR